MAPGESKEYEVTLTWKNTSENFGTKQNIAELMNLNNEAGFEEETKKDNEDIADLILSVSTGIVNTRNGIITIFIVLIILGIRTKMKLTDTKSSKSKKARRNN